MDAGCRDSPLNPSNQNERTGMDDFALKAISPVDGRYWRVTASLGDYFSEGALIRYRVLVEVEYFIALCELPLPPLRALDAARRDALRAVYRNFSHTDATRVKAIEATTNHDVKAVEYFLKE
jgi:adenylosuccinate lyase